MSQEENAYMCDKISDLNHRMKFKDEVVGSHEKEINRQEKDIWNLKMDIKNADPY